MSYPKHGAEALSTDDAKQAQTEILHGAAVGALKMGAVMALVGGIGYATSPVYRGLTVQFKTYIQMAGMIVGGAVEADYRLRQHEARVRVQKRIARDKAMWETFEKEYEEEGAPPPPPKPKHLKEN